jgi:hypothetical protein
MQELLRRLRESVQCAPQRLAAAEVAKLRRERMTRSETGRVLEREEAIRSAALQRRRTKV